MTAETMQNLSECLKVELSKVNSSPSLDLLRHCLKIFTSNSGKKYPTIVEKTDSLSRIAYQLSCHFGNPKLPSKIISLSTSIESTRTGKRYPINSTKNSVITKSEFFKEILPLYNET